MLRDHMGKENTTILGRDWKVIILDVKSMKVIWSLSNESFFYMSNLKNGSPKKYEVKGNNMPNPNQFIASQNLL